MPTLPFVLPFGLGDEMVTRGQWAQAFLEQLDAPVTKRNLTAMVAWIASEGGFAKWNPLNTTKKMPSNLPPYNSVPVQNYDSMAEGLQAATLTIHEPDKGYGRIIRRLQNNAWPARTLDAIYESQWGTQPIPYLLRSVKRSYDYYASQPIGA